MCLSAVALWRVRGRRGVLAWGAALVVAIALGWIGHVGLAAGQRELERRAQAFFLNWIRRGDLDPYRSTTVLGDLGELKLYDTIVMRIEPGANARMPMRLRQASYNVYHGPAWLAVDAPFRRVQPEADGATWLREAIAEARADGALATAPLWSLLARVLARGRPVTVVYTRGGWVNVNNLTDLIDASGL